jgi:hypothetical protein
MKRLLLLCLGVVAAALVPVGVGNAPTAGTYTSAAIALGTNPTTAGTTVDATATFEILTVPGPSEKISLSVSLLGTNGNGTFTAGSSDSGGTCAIGTTNRSYTCEFLPGDLAVGQTIVISTTVSVSAAAVPATYEVEAYGVVVDTNGQRPDSLDTAGLVIETVPPTTEPPTTEQPTTVPPTWEPAGNGQRHDAAGTTRRPVPARRVLGAVLRPADHAASKRVDLTRAGPAPWALYGPVGGRAPCRFFR